MFPAAMVLPMFNGQPLVSPRPAASASAEIPRVWQCAAHDLHHHHHFVRLRFSRRMPLFNQHTTQRTSSSCHVSTVLNARVVGLVEPV